MPQPLTSAVPALARFNRCPQCGVPDNNDRKSKAFTCKACGFVLYVNVGSAFAGLISDDDGRLLVIKRAKEPSKGLLAFPGGFADPGETAEDGLRREIREEVGLQVKIVGYLCSHPNLYEYRGIAYQTLDLFYVCSIVSPEDVRLTLQASEIAGSEWRDPKSIELEELAFPSLRWALTCYRNTHARISRDSD
jgi:ADP-ribose pyrophosphatase YjhB (NUDIX family)